MKTRRDALLPELKRAPSPESRHSPAHSRLLAMQRLAGNGAVARVLSGAAPAASHALQREPVLPGLAPIGERGVPGQRPTIRQGSNGEDVRHAQERLNAHGAAPPLDTDGIFGPLTRRGTVSYQHSHALDPDGIVGPRSWASLEGPTSVGGSSGQGRPPAPSGVPPAQVLRYDTSAYRLAAPAPGTTMADLRRAVQQKQALQPPDLGPTVTVTGVTVGSPAELFVWNALLQLSTRNRWGTEADLVTAIGPPTVRPPAPAPVGRITVRIDGQGNATASLLAAGPVPPSLVFANRQIADTALTALGFAAVQDGSAPWTLQELSKVHAALSRMPAADRPALDGVTLVREREIIRNGESLSGLFEHQATLAVGATTATRSASLKITNSAFAGDDVSFIGDATTGAPASFETIVHEAGHAVETKALRDAQFATMQAQGVLNGAITNQNAAIATFNTTSRTAFTTANGYTQVQRGQGRAFLNSINAATRALQAMTQNNAPAQNSARDTAATRAVAARDRARAALATSTPAHPALTDFTATLTSQDNWLTAARARAAANAVVEQRRADERAVTGAPGQSRRLQNFVTHVNQNNIPPLTEYARRNWPAHPEEFFAEAYSLWRNDRAYLQTNAPTLVTWFDGGGHLQ